MQQQRVPDLDLPSDLFRDDLGVWEDNPFLEAADFQPGKAITVIWFGDGLAFWVFESLPNQALAAR